MRLSWPRFSSFSGFGGKAVSKKHHLYKAINLGQCILQHGQIRTSWCFST